MVPGLPAWAGCNDPCNSNGAGGQLTVNVARVYASTSFPAEDREVRGLRNCPPPTITAIDLVITLLRCAPGPDARGCPPGCDELSAAARILNIDALTVYSALLCCLPSTAPVRRGRRFVMGAQRMLGPEGGCVGVEQRVTVALSGCLPCPTEESP